MLWSRSLVNSHGKLKSLYLHYLGADSYQTWQDCNLPWCAPAIKSHYLFIMWSRKSQDKLKSLYLRYHSAYGHQTRQAADLPCGASMDNIPLFRHVVLRDHETNWNHYISTTTNLWLQNLAGWWLTLTAFYPKNPMTT